MINLNEHAKEAQTIAFNRWQKKGVEYNTPAILKHCAGEYDDGKEWLHVSVSRKSKLPTYEELTRIKRDFIGDDKKAVFVLPEKEKHVNIHNYCLHLFYSAENPLPDFTGGICSL